MYYIYFLFTQWGRFLHLHDHGEEGCQRNGIPARYALIKHLLSFNCSTDEFFLLIYGFIQVPRLELLTTRAFVKKSHLPKIHGSPKAVSRNFSSALLYSKTTEL